MSNWFVPNGMPDAHAVPQIAEIESLHWVDYAPDSLDPTLLAVVLHKREKMLVYDFYRGRPE